MDPKKRPFSLNIFYFFFFFLLNLIYCIILGSNSCNVDLGNGYYVRKSNGKLYAVGIVTYKKVQEDKNSNLMCDDNYSVFSEIHVYKKWIKTVTKNPIENIGAVETMTKIDSLETTKRNIYKADAVESTIKPDKKNPVTTERNIDSAVTLESTTETIKDEFSTIKNENTVTMETTTIKNDNAVNLESTTKSAKETMDISIENDYGSPTKVETSKADHKIHFPTDDSDDDIDIRKN